MEKDYMVAVPIIVTATNTGVEFYDKIELVECRAKNLKEIYNKFPNALNVRVKEK